MAKSMESHTSAATKLSDHEQPEAGHDRLAAEHAPAARMGSGGDAAALSAAPPAPSEGAARSAPSASSAPSSAPSAPCAPSAPSAPRSSTRRARPRTPPPSLSDPQWSLRALAALSPAAPESAHPYALAARAQAARMAGMPALWVRERDDDELPPTKSFRPTTAGDAPPPANDTAPGSPPSSSSIDAGGSGGFELGREHEASLREVLLAGFAAGTGDLGAGYLRHLADELSLLAQHYADVEGGRTDELTPRALHELLSNMAQQARAVAELQLRLTRSDRDPNAR